jgi:hypothetical protein
MRRDFCLYVDEFQNFSTDSFADILSQARKYHLNLIVANQFTTQLSEEIRDAVFGNVGSVISFRVGTTDAEFLAKQFAPTFDIDDLQFLPNANTAVRMMIGGVPVQPFSMATLPPLGSPNKQLMDALKQLSAAKYGRPKATVGADISKRLTTVAPSRPSLPSSGQSIFDKYGVPPPRTSAALPASSSPFAVSAAQPQLGPTLPKAAGSSFLDEWLEKRKTALPKTATASPAAPMASAQAPTVASPTASPAFSPPSIAIPAQPAMPPSGEGVFKINRDENKMEDSGTMHIDNDGNISYGA